MISVNKCLFKYACQNLQEIKISLQVTVEQMLSNLRICKVSYQKNSILKISEYMYSLGLFRICEKRVHKPQHCAQPVLPQKPAFLNLLSLWYTNWRILSKFLIENTT